MNYITGINRNQILMQCMEERIAADNAVRVIEALVNALDLTKLNFRHPYVKKMKLKLVLGWCSFINQHF
ncbi:MAG: hypothetical protein ABIT08_05505 [Bacteroidia bacterium]